MQAGRGVDDDGGPSMTHDLLTRTHIHQDEEDVDEAAYDAIRPRAAQLREEMRRHLADGNRGEVIRSGIRVAIVGPPNAGKSTLLNLLARRPAAIVSPIAGTTRCVADGLIQWPRLLAI